MDDDACAFLGFFVSPPPELERQAVDAAQAGLDAGRPLRTPGGTADCCATTS
ncbi:hypothetical protein [Plantactinospora sp. KLBMP9567]|uniref:hypothetical protein n=1 Tax=Plantactinospora sp. KLBMP9567 TaxID=3085900 RepID=UPI002982A7A6|nr:hypothetical protein [Plantactinospora sp. KLBMP9567]MDW5324215.1 hypothetical protein [Plantactinospora sp. KLBMP9567]